MARYNTLIAALAVALLATSVHAVANTTSPTPNPPASPKPSPSVKPSPNANNTSPTPSVSPKPSPSNNGTNNTSPSPVPSPAKSPSPSPAPTFPCAANTTVDFYVRRPLTWVIIDVPVCTGYSWYLTDEAGDVALEHYHGTYKEKDGGSKFFLQGSDNPEDRFFKTPAEAAAAIDMTKALVNDTKNYKVTNNTNILTLVDPKDGKVIAYHTGISAAEKDAAVAAITKISKKATDWTVAPTDTSPSPSPTTTGGSGLKKIYDLKLWEIIVIGAGALLLGIILASLMCRTCCRPGDHSDESAHLLGRA